MNAVLVADDRDNEAVFPSPEEAVTGIQGWFDDALEASCQGLSTKGIEAMFPGLLARLHDAVAAVPTPALELDPIARYANSVAEKVLAVCGSDDEREAVGVPARFTVRPAQ